MAKYCANCGRELPDEAMYCPECGKKFVPRYKADDSDSDSGSDFDNQSSSDYEFNGPFGPSDKKFEGPFGPHSNRGSDESLSSSSKSYSDDSKGNPSALSNIFDNIGIGKVCIVLFLVLLIFFAISNMASQSSDSNNLDSSVFTDSANDISSNDYMFGNQDIEGKGSIDRNEPYNISIDENAYLSGKGEMRLIDSNHSYNIESEEFNITEYETYYVNVDDADWYVVDVFKCKFDNLSQSQVYSIDLSDGDPIIIYGGKGDYYGYGIIMPNSSDDSKYKNIGFLESIFHYKKQ